MNYEFDLESMRGSMLLLLLAAGLIAFGYVCGYYAAYLKFM